MLKELPWNNKAITSGSLKWFMIFSRSLKHQGLLIAPSPKVWPIRGKGAGIRKETAARKNNFRQNKIRLNWALDLVNKMYGGTRRTELRLLKEDLSTCVMSSLAKASTYSWLFLWMHITVMFGAWVIAPPKLPYCLKTSAKVASLGKICTQVPYWASYTNLPLLAGKNHDQLPS